MTELITAEMVELDLPPGDKDTTTARLVDRLVAALVKTRELFG